jgi:hypothetical protein
MQSFRADKPEEVELNDADNEWPLGRERAYLIAFVIGGIAVDWYCADLQDKNA